MRIYQTIVKRFIQDAPGAGFIAAVIRSGIELINRFTLPGGTILSGISVSATDYQLRGAPGAGFTAQTPGLIIDLLGVLFSGTRQDTGFLASLSAVTGSAATPAQNPALDHKTVIAQFQTPENPALELVRITYDLTHRSGANGTLCTCAGNVLAVRCGRLNLAYANFVNKSELTITQVNLHFYYSQNSVLAGASTGGSNFGGADTQLFSNAALTNVNALTTPQTYDITASVAGSWTNLDNLMAYVIAEIGALALNLIDTIKTMLAARDQKIAALGESSAALKEAITILASIEPVQNGKDGKDGKDVDPGSIEKLVAEMVA